MIKQLVLLLFTFIFSINLFAQPDNINKEITDIKFQIQEIKVLDAHDKKIERIEQKLEELKNEFNRDIIDKNKTEITIYQVSTLIFSFIALVISWMAFNLNNKKDKLVLKVIPCSEHNSNGVIHLSNKEFIKEKSTGYFGIQLVNHSYFEVNINQIFFLSNDYPNEQLIPDNGFFDINKSEQIFPINLTSKNSIMIYFKIVDILGKNIKSIKIKLTTGENIEGSSSALNSFVKFNSK